MGRVSIAAAAKRYGRRIVLAPRDHTFSDGVTVITGPSGVGKSTLLRLLASAEKPSAGHVLWDGRDIRKNLRAFRTRLGYAPQRIDFPEDLSGLDFMRHVAALKGLPLAASTEQATALLGRLGLGRDAHRRISTYSGGMRRRLGVAQAALGAPELLVLDEPTAELDPVTAWHVLDLVFELSERATVVMTTHLQGSLEGRDAARLVLVEAD